MSIRWIYLTKKYVLLERKSELLLSGHLTWVCRLKHLECTNVAVAFELQSMLTVKKLWCRKSFMARQEVRRQTHKVSRVIGHRRLKALVCTRVSDGKSKR